MRYRFRVSLYDDSDLDKEILDYLSSTSRKQEMLRTFIRAGFAMIINKQEGNLAYIESIDDEQKSIFAQLTRHASNLAASQNSRVSHYQDRSFEQEQQPPVKEPEYLTKRSNAPEKQDGKANAYSDVKSGDSSQGGENDLSSFSEDDPVDFMTLLQ